jgi:FMN-dependent oxidoreductase (nitrilotriacetate monooxygenase family)
MTTTLGDAFVATNQPNKAHLLGFSQHGVNSHATGMWRHPKDKVNWDYARPEYWQHMARTMERGLFDAMFIADELAPYNTYANSSDETVRWAVQCPTHEPSTIVPIISTATKHLGVGITLSTAFEHPYSMSRRLSSLDHLSSGRIAWNIVSSYSKSEWEAYGAELTERAARYDQLEEYMEVCYKLWDSWEPDAVVADKINGIYADPSKVHEVNHQGHYYRCRGRHFCTPSPQGRPVMWQAGSSPRGRDFAAKHAEAIFAVHPNVQRMRQYSDDLNERMFTKFNRPEGSVKLIFGVQPIVGASRAEALEKQEEIRALVPQQGALALISGHFGLDFSKYKPEEIIQNIEIFGIQGMYESIVHSRGGGAVTVAEAAQLYGLQFSMPQLVGTAADIADQMEVFLDEGGADGFMLLATYTPGCFEEFADLVVPELQRRGRFRKEYTGSTLRHHLNEY